MVSWVYEGVLGVGGPQGVTQCKKPGFQSQFHPFSGGLATLNAREIFRSRPRAKVEPDLNSSHKNALLKRF